MSASVLAFEDRPDLIGAFALWGVHRDVVGRSANNISPRRGRGEECQEARSGTVERVDDARSCGQRAWEVELVVPKRGATALSSPERSDLTAYMSVAKAPMSSATS